MLLFRSKKQGKQGTKGRGVSLPYMRLETIFLTTENPLVFSGEKAKNTKQTKPKEKALKGAKTRPKRVSSYSNQKVTLMKVLKQVKTRFFYVIHKA